NIKRRRTREQEIAGLIRAIEELGTEASALVDPVAKQQGNQPVGRCATAIANAVRDAVSRESALVRGELAGIRDEIDREDREARTRARVVLEKLLRAHDLPGATNELEVVWSGHMPKATMRQRTEFGVEAVLSLDAAASPLLGSELRVERIDPTV